MNINKPIYYESLDDMTIWEWEQLHKNNDWTYLMKKGKPDYRAPAIYKDLLSQFEYLSAPVLRAKKKILLEVIDLVINIAENSQDLEKLYNASRILNAIIISGEHSDWLFTVDFTETPEQRGMLTNIAVAIKNHERIKESRQSDDKPQSLNQKIVAMEQLLGVKIDPRVTSVLLFATYEKSALDKIRSQNRNIN